MILLYHKIHPETKTMWWVSPDAFYLQMLDLQSKKVVYLDDYDPRDPAQCVITFDGVYDNVWKFGVPILRHFGYPFELFVVGDQIGKGNEFDAVEPPAEFADLGTLQKMMEAGGRLQWHTATHPVLVGEQPEDVVRRELTVPDNLRALCPDGFKWLAYPHGQRDDGLKARAARYFTGALACDDGVAGDRYDLPRITVVEKTRFASSTVSLIIPCYNYGHLAAEAIESALLQTYPPDEILFIDDASTDNSVEVARRYEPRIRVEVNKRNLGIVENFNKAVLMTKGDYICLLGADNRFRSDYIEKSKAILDANPAVGVVYTHFAMFGSKAAVEATRTGAAPHARATGIFVRKFPAAPGDIRLDNYIHGSSMYRRKAFHQAGGYSSGELPEDHSLFARMLDHGWKAQLWDAPSLEYRQHSKDQVNLLKTYEAETVYLRGRVQSLTAQVHRHEATVQQLSSQLSEITGSRAWRLALLLRRSRVALVPPGSFPVRVMRRLRAALSLPVNKAQLALKSMSDYRLVRSSGLFDQAWYLANHPNVVPAKVDPLRHYLEIGGFEGMDPNPNFSSTWYLHTYEDVRTAKMNPLLHYLRFGRAEGRATKYAPKVSIIIPAFNGRATIEQTIESILKQEYGNYEIVVVDDGSTDGTMDLVRKLLPAARIAEQENRGTMSARQAGLNLAQGELVAFLDQDDLWFAQNLRVEIDALNQLPAVGLVLANMEAIDNDGDLLGFNLVADDKCYTPSWEELLLLHPTATTVALFRREVLLSLGGLDTNFGGSGAFGDYDMFLRMSEGSWLHYVNQTLGRYRWVETRPGRLASFLDNLPIYARKYWNHPRLQDENGAELRRQFVEILCNYARHIFGLLLKQYDGKVSRDLLLRLNAHNGMMEELFGDAYRTYVGIGAIDSGALSSADQALDPLLFQYLLRRDLQDAFPKAIHGDFRDLLKHGASMVASAAAAGIRESPEDPRVARSQGEP